MNAFTTHWTSAVPAAKARPIAGRATLSTEPSMKARLEASMQVASTSFGYGALPPAVAAPAAPSHGAGRLRLTRLWTPDRDGAGLGRHCGERRDEEIQGRAEARDLFADAAM